MKKVLRTIHMLIWGAANSDSFREVRFVLIHSNFTASNPWSFYLSFHKPRLHVPHFLEIDYCRATDIVGPFDEIPF